MVMTTTTTMMIIEVLGSFLTLVFRLLADMTIGMFRHLRLLMFCMMRASGLWVSSLHGKRCSFESMLAFGS
jgi:hypothetical protein